MNAKGSTSENGVGESDAMRNGMLKQSSLLKKSTKAKRLAPLWQYSTRKIDYEESYFSRRGTAFVSAPRSVLTSVRSIPHTILTLWIPLIPLMLFFFIVCFLLII